MNTYIPVKKEYALENAHVMQIFYFKGTTEGESIESSLKKVSASATLRKLFQSASCDCTVGTKAEKAKSKEEKEKALSSLDDYKFYVKSFVTEKDVNELIEIERQMSELKERRDALNNLLTSEFMLYYNNNEDAPESIVTEEGTVSSTLAYNISIEKAKALKKILDDYGDYIEVKKEYKLAGIASDAIRCLVSGNYNNKKTLDEFVNEIIQKPKVTRKNGTVISAEELKTSFKSTVKSNVTFLMKVFDITESHALNLAVEYEQIKNWLNIANFFRTCGVDPEDTNACNEFKEKIERTLTVKKIHRLTVTPN